MNIRLADTTQTSQLVRTAEASTLGIPAGRWPDRITARGFVFDLVEIEHDQDGDTILARYVDGLHDLIIYND